MYLYECDRCGRFDIGGSFEHHRSFAGDPMPMLCGLIRRAYDSGEGLGIIDYFTEAELSPIAPKDQSEIVRQLLFALKRKTDRRGQAVALDPNKDYPLAFGVDSADLLYCLDELQSDELVRFVEGDTAIECTITVAGWKAIDEVERSGVVGAEMSSSDEVAGLNVFYSYSHKNEKIRANIVDSLAVPMREGKVRHLWDRQILPGQNIDSELSKMMEAADVFLLLTSREFLASDYCYTKEMTRAIERHEAGDATLVAIILSACDWQSTPLKRLKVLPLDGKPITEWRNRDRAYQSITDGIRAVVDSMLERRKGGVVDSRTNVGLPLSEEATSLLKGAARGDGFIVVVDFKPWLVIRAGSYAVDGTGNQRLQASHVEAIGELMRLGYLRQSSDTQYDLTPSGFGMADKLNGS